MSLAKRLWDRAKRLFRRKPRPKAPAPSSKPSKQPSKRIKTTPSTKSKKSDKLPDGCDITRLTAPRKSPHIEVEYSELDFGTGYKKPGDITDNVFKARLKSIMTDNKYDRRIPKRRRGRLDMHHLYKAEVGSQALFTQKQARKGKEYNILLVVDESGSMAGPKIDMAADVVTFLAKNFQESDINLAILGFNHFLTTHKEFKQTLTDYDELHADIRDAVEHGGSCNHDYHALLKGYKILEKNRGVGKDILIFISDGNPEHCNEKQANFEKTPLTASQQKQGKYLNALVRAHEGMVTTIGVGIFTDCWQCPDRIQVNSLGELKPEILEILGRKIKRG